MSDEMTARLAAIGSYTVETDDGDEFLSKWDTVPQLVSDLGSFGLEFRVTSSIAGALNVDDEMFRLWETWQSRHTEYVGVLRQAVAARMEDLGVCGDPADQIVEAQIAISREGDADGPEQYVSATVPRRFDGEYAVLCCMDPESGELEFK